MGILNRIVLLLFTMINVIVFVSLSIISPRWYAVYSAYTSDKVIKFLWQEKNDLKGK